MRICLATPDVDGPVLGGEIGTAYTALAEALAQAGHQVSILLLPAEGSQPGTDTAGWVDYFRVRGIDFVRLPVTSPPEIGAYDHPRLAYWALLWLRDQAFDLVHFPDRGGYAYYVLLAKHQGLAFPSTLFCIGAYGPTLWAQLAQHEPVGSMEQVVADFMEQQSIAMADAVIASSRYLLHWMQKQGWRLPDRTWVLPNIVPRHLRYEVGAGAQPVREVVFFGPLEHQGDLVLCCNALDRLGQGSPRDLQVTFLAPPSARKAAAFAYLRSRAKRWAFPYRTLIYRSWDEAIDYLRGRGRAAVAGGRMVNTPYQVLTCLAGGIPLLGARVGGIPELITKEDEPQVCFDPRPDRLAERLELILREGLTPARLLVAAATTEQEWVRWHERLQAPRQEQHRLVHTSPASRPLVSVCITHFDRPKYLALALNSIKTQDYANFEVVLVDDGSTRPDAVRYVDELEAEFSLRHWRVIRQENRFLGAARNTAAKHSRGQYLLFMDDDNYAKPHEISTYVAVAEKTGADILTCFADLFFGDGAPNLEDVPHIRNLAVGPALSFGLYNCGFGDANALVRRIAFDRLGGFTEDYGVGAEDWEFFARAVFMGLKLEVVPEALFWYRAHDTTMFDITGIMANYLRAVRPYLDVMPPELRSLLLFSQGQYLKTTSVRLSGGARPADLFWIWRAVNVWLRHPGRSRLLRRLVMTARTQGIWTALTKMVNFGQRG